MGRKFDAGSIVDAGAVLERLKEHFEVEENAALIEKLGITKQMLTNWKARNYLDFPLILARCPDVDLNWLFRGTPFEDSPMFKELRKQQMEMRAELDALKRMVKPKGK